MEKYVRFFPVIVYCFFSFLEGQRFSDWIYLPWVDTHSCKFTENLKFYAQCYSESCLPCRFLPPVDFLIQGLHPGFFRGIVQNDTEEAGESGYAWFPN